MLVFNADALKKRQSIKWALNQFSQSILFFQNFCRSVPGRYIRSYLGARCNVLLILGWILLLQGSTLLCAAPQNCYLNQNATLLANIPTAHEGRIILLRHRAKIWWSKKRHPKKQWPKEILAAASPKSTLLHVTKDAYLDPYKDPLSLYLSLCLLPRLNDNSTNHIHYIALPTALAKLGFKGSDQTGFYLSYNEGLQLLEDIGVNTVEEMLALNALQSAYKGEYSYWQLLGEFLIPASSLNSSADITLIWLKNRLGFQTLAQKAIPLSTLPLKDTLAKQRAKALEEFIYALIEHEQFSSHSPPHLLVFPSGNRGTGLERWESLLRPPTIGASLFTQAEGKENHHDNRAVIYDLLDQAMSSNANPKSNSYQQLTDALLSNYSTLLQGPEERQGVDESPQTFITQSPSILLPAFWQLKAAEVLESIPVDILSAIFWSFALVFSIFPRLKKLTTWSFYTAFSWLSLALILRILILQRPPVSNMYETLLYVPWIIGATAIYTGCADEKLRTPMLSLALVCTLFSLSIDVERSLVPAIAVLNSSFWLGTHVLLVVGSYGVLLLASALSHRDLFLSFFNTGWEKTTASSRRLSLHLVQWGTSALVLGTLLGGVWAAQSWGRFWDWDPKESWALISSAYYLILIHLARFYPISPAVFCIINASGALFISFTWYGVNYILGVGLHSYGFGSDSHLAYTLYVIGELLFLLIAGGYHFFLPSSSQSKVYRK